ncbi:MAG TPA: hypothetical protein VMD47_10200 [Candidatus Acidoferrales bacterium]|nr:hypothetical protein [Candidatus Acidoferrales bacterium]
MSQTSMRLEALFADLRSIERDARARLVVGCAEDDARIERYFEKPLQILKNNAADALAAMGSGLERDLARNLRRETFDRIGMGFARLVSANVDLRARARFRLYAQELADAEIAIVQAIAAMRVVRAKRMLPRMFAIQRVSVDDLRFPEPPESASEIGDWVKELHGLVREAVRRRVDAALLRVLAHGSDRLGIVKSRIDLALRTPPRSRLRAARA